MKCFIIFTALSFLVCSAFGQSNISNKKSTTMENEKIIQAVITVFSSVDERNWDKVSRQFADVVTLDYTSLNGGKPQQLSGRQIATQWAAFLPGFDKTKHEVKNIQVDVSGNTAKVNFVAKGVHYLGDEAWVAAGNFEDKLQKFDGEWKITHHKFIVKEQSGNTELSKKAQAIMEEKLQRKVQFSSGGMVLHGVLHLPLGFDESKKYKAIVVTGSWLTVKEQMATLYAKKLALEGYLPFVFDFRNYGESEGKPRNYEVPELKAEDIKNAVVYLKTLPFVDASKIGGLAICASSGYLSLAIVKGADIKAANFVAPWLHNSTLVAPLYGGEDAVKAKIAEAEKAKEEFTKTGKSKEVLAASKTDKTAAMPGDFPYYLDEKRGAIPEWDNKMAVMSWKPWLEFDAVSLAKQVTIPVQIIHSEKAAVPDGTKQYYKGLSGKKNIIWVTDNPTQFDFYDQEPYTTNAVNDTVKWFQQQLQ